MTELEAMFPPMQDSLGRIWSLERERAQLYRERYQSLLLEFDTGSNNNDFKIPPVPTSNGNGTSTNGNGSNGG